MGGSAWRYGVVIEAVPFGLFRTLLPSYLEIPKPSILIETEAHVSNMFAVMRKVIILLMLLPEVQSIKFSLTQSKLSRSAWFAQ